MTEQRERPEALEPYQIVGELLAAMRVHRKHADRYVRRTGLHPTQHRVLMYLSRQEGRIRQRALSDHFELTPAAVAQILDKLEGEGYVTRETAEDDSRCKYVTLTERGRETAAESAKSFRCLDAKLLENISDGDLAVLRRVLAQMQENLQEDKGKESYGL